MWGVLIIGREVIEEVCPSRVHPCEVRKITFLAILCESEGEGEEKRKRGGRKRRRERKRN